MNKLALFILMLLPLSANAVTGSVERPAAAKAAATLNCFQRRPFLQMTMKWDEAGGFHLALLSQEGIAGLPLFNAPEDGSPWRWCRVLGQIAGRYLLLETDGGVLRLTGRGVLLSNEVFQEFITP